jgi:hypothetical protein
MEQKLSFSKEVFGESVTQGCQLVEFASGCANVQNNSYQQRALSIQSFHA